MHSNDKTTGKRFTYPATVGMAFFFFSRLRVAGLEASSKLLIAGGEGGRAFFTAGSSQAGTEEPGCSFSLAVVVAMRGTSTTSSSGQSFMSPPTTDFPLEICADDSASALVIGSPASSSSPREWSDPSIWA